MTLHKHESVSFDAVTGVASIQTMRDPSGMHGLSYNLREPRIDLPMLMLFTELLTGVELQCQLETLFGKSGSFKLIFRHLAAPEDLEKTITLKITLADTHRHLDRANDSRPPPRKMKDFFDYAGNGFRILTWILEQASDMNVTSRMEDEHLEWTLTAKLTSFRNTRQR